MLVGDLFCGAGGLSLGFARAGFDIAFGVDCDDSAVETFRANHGAMGICDDLTLYEPGLFYEKYDINYDRLDGIIGGPPCQGFSLSNVERSVDDERNNLVFVFAEHIEYVQPPFFLMENVPGIRSLGGGLLFDRLLADFEEAGYYVSHRTLNAARYGVPQERERVFVQGLVSGPPSWPEPTHRLPDEDEESSAPTLDEW